jgi:hypothetical protein
MPRLIPAAVFAAALFALPAGAQQDTTGRAAQRPTERTAQDAGQGMAADTLNRPTTAVPGAEQMGADSAKLGRQGEGVSQPSVGGQQPTTPKPPVATPTDNGGNATTPRETGAAMPTTASSLPALFVIGSLLTLAGLLARRRT